MKELRGFVTEIIVIGMTMLVGLITLFIPTVTWEVKYLVWALGALMATFIITLKTELISRFDERIEIYRMVEEIRDEELRKMGYVFIDECKHKLEDLAKGIFVGEASEVFNLAISRMQKARAHVQATHIATTPERIHGWEDLPVLVNYYAANGAAVSRGVRIERIFILKNDLLFDSSSGEIKDARAVEIIEKLANEGIDVMVVWEDQVPAELIEDFIIFDGSVVHAERVGAAGLYEGGTVIKNPTIVQQYVNKFDRLKTHSQAFDKCASKSLLLRNQDHDKPKNT